jgi:drug/metabolite transporter (DMT)-like permease
MTVQVSQIILASLIVIGFFGCLLALLIHPATLSDLNREPVMLMIGALIAAFAGIVGYFFGSSAGSARKTALLARAEPIIDLTDKA